MINKYNIPNGPKFISKLFGENDSWTKYISNGKIELWRSIGISQESIKNPHTSDTTFSPELIEGYTQFVRVWFKGICLKQGSVYFLIKNS